jgi:hypothetical protein
MSLRFTSRALAEAKRVKTWWRRNRPAAQTSSSRSSRRRFYEEGDLDVPVRRVLLPKTLNHVYYAIDGEDVVVLSVWGGLHERGPKL